MLRGSSFPAPLRRPEPSGTARRSRIASSTTSRHSGSSNGCWRSSSTASGAPDGVDPFEDAALGLVSSVFAVTVALVSAVGLLGDRDRAALAQGGDDVVVGHDALAIVG